MRALVMVLLAGCYQPPAATSCAITCTTACPPGLDCVGGLCVEPGVPCPTDGSTPLCPIPTVAQSETVVVAGSSFVAKLDGEMYATRFAVDNAGTILGTLGAITQPASYVIIAQDLAQTTYRSPRLALGGQELFLRLDMSSTSMLARTTRMPGTNIWTTVALQVVDATLADSDVPSTPTATVPRRMVISRVGGYLEIEERTAGQTWKVIDTQTVAQYEVEGDKVTFLGDAHLTPDGLRLVFRGQVGAGIVGAFVLERPKLGVPFDGPARQLPASGSVSNPYWTPDCKNLFYDRASENAVYRVVY